MLIARAPLSFSLGGAGTDLDAYASKYGGAVIAATITKYCYVLISSNTDGSVRIASTDNHILYGQRLQSAAPWEEPMVRTIVDHFGIRGGYSIFLACELPPNAGLGSEAALAVALITALAQLSHSDLSRHEIAELACQTEADVRRVPVSRWQPYAAVFGGLNLMEFTSSSVVVNPIAAPEGVRAALERRLMLFFTRPTPNSAELWAEQRRNAERNRATAIAALHTAKEAGLGLGRELWQGEVKAVGPRLHESWLAMREMARGVSDGWIDQWYDAARTAGATGGKLIGPGGGGFLLLDCDPSHHERVQETLQARGLHRMDLHLEAGGAAVLMNTLVEPVAGARVL